jgi:hypothetical protein
MECIVSYIGTYFLLTSIHINQSLPYNITVVAECGMPVTCKSKGGKFSVHNPSLGSAVESWTALLHTLASAKPEWWRISVSVDIMSDTGMNALGDAGGVPVAPSRQGDDASENNGPIVDLQAMEHCSSSTPCIAEDETVYGTAESCPLSDDEPASLARASRHRQARVLTI